MNEKFNYLGVNVYQGKTFYHKESFDILLNWIYTLSVIANANKFLVKHEVKTRRKGFSVRGSVNEKNFIAELSKETAFYGHLKVLSDQAEYVIEKLRKLVKLKKAVTTSTQSKAVIKTKGNKRKNE